MNDFEKKDYIESGSLVIDIQIKEDRYEFTSNISSALCEAELELEEIERSLSESLETLQKLSPNCDKTDYILAASSGVLCGVMDIFLIGKPSESPIGDLTDKWFENRTKDFAGICGWDRKNGTLESAIRYLEKKFKIPYDQRGAGDAAGMIFDLNPGNHHFKSLGHNPTLLGLFFSVLDQFLNTSHFVSEGELITLEKADDGFGLRGNNLPAKFFCGFVNWFGHLISDATGSSASKGRGMGIPSPLLSRSNDIIAIKRQLNLTPSVFDKSFNEVALQIYKKSYDIRFQTAQIIPVFVNELVVRLIYSVRRLVQYFKNISKENHSFERLWSMCEPISNATVKRMLTVAHGAFCLVDAGDAIIRGFATGGGCFNVSEFFMRLNIIGVGRFTISLYGEFNRGFKRSKVHEDVNYWRREKTIIEDYIYGLTSLADIYDDKMLLTFIDDLKKSDIYIQAFEKTVVLAKKRNVPENEILKNITEIDSYFKAGNK